MPVHIIPRVCARVVLLTSSSSAPLFTSNETLWPPTVAGFNSLSGDPAANPLYSTYSRVFVPYCTQDMLLLDTESSDGGLQFRGRPYLE